jgi:hypothetical protein
MGLLVKFEKPKLGVVPFHLRGSDLGVESLDLRLVSGDCFLAGLDSRVESVVVRAGRGQFGLNLRENFHCLRHLNEIANEVSNMG